MQRRKYVPRPYAGLALDFMSRNDRCAIWARPGSGKSVLTLTFIDSLQKLMGEPGPALVLAPLRVARDTWADEASKWEHLDGLRVSPVVGTPAERKAALSRSADVYVTNYEQLPWLVDQIGSGWPFTTVVADETTRLKSFRLGGSGGTRARALSKVAFGPTKRWINLTGTPSANGLEDLWGQTWFLDRGERLGRTFTAFRDRWFRSIPLGTAGGIRIEPLAHAEAEIRSRLKDICLTIDPADWLPGLKEPIFNTVGVHLPKKQQAEYDALEREMFLQLKSGNVVDPVSAGSVVMKCRQYAAGAVIHSKDGSWEEVHSEKIDALEGILSESGDEPVLVGYYFKSDLERLRKRWPDALVLARADDLAAARKGKGRVWLGHPDSLGHGVDGLQDWCSTVVFFSHDWKLESRMQFIDRVGGVRQLQSGRNRVVFVHDIVARGTIDEVILQRHKSKARVQDALLDYMKEKVNAI